MKVSLAISSSIFIIIFFFSPSIAQNSPRDFLAVHNAARAALGIQPLSWNHTVASYAENYANLRGSDCNLEHSQGPFGENIAEGSGEFTVVDAVNMWVGEKPYYDDRSNSCVGGECLHYTQVVWSSTAQIGCARVQCRNEWSLLLSTGKLCRGTSLLRVVIEMM